MIKGKDFIIHGIQSLDVRIGSNCVNIAKEISKHNRVLYLNYPLDRFSTFRERSDHLIQKRLKMIKDKEQALVKINDNMWNLYPPAIIESINYFNFRPLHTFFNKRNNKIYAEKVKDAIKELNFTDYIIFNDSDFIRAFYFKELLNPSLSIYYTRDNLRATPYFSKRIYLEDQLMEKSDMVTANSTYLQGIAKEQNPNSFYVGQGCDVSLFNRDLIKEIPADVRDIKSPMIGYIGALRSSRLDIEVLEHIAKSKPEWNVLLVGPEDEKFQQSNLHSMKNVIFTGSKKMDDLPKYLAAFDVALNPQALNPLTIGNYPRKIDEYLAMGKPVVATLTETMIVFKDYCYLAETKEEYVSLIEQALNEDNEERTLERINFGNTHTWENNVSEIYKAILKVSPNI